MVDIENLEIKIEQSEHKYKNQGRLGQCTVFRKFRNSNKTDKNQSAFYYHHALVILNNVSDNTFLPEKAICWSKF